MPISGLIAAEKTLVLHNGSLKKRSRNCRMMAAGRRGETNHGDFARRAGVHQSIPRAHSHTRIRIISEY
jgi:hypothetical protein